MLTNTMVGGGGVKDVIALNPAAWFRYGVGISSSGGAVSQWADQSGNGRHLKQATGANQPVLLADGAIDFDGTTAQWLKCDAFTLAQPETVYVLFKADTWTNLDHVFDGNAAENMTLMQGAPATPALRMRATTSAIPNSDLALGVFGIAACVFSGASSVLQINNGTPATGDPGSTGGGGLTLGARSDGVGPMDMVCKELIVFAAAHDAAQRARIIRYMAKVGGLSL